VQDLRYGLREVLRLRPVPFAWNDAALGPPTVGLIAQDVAPVLPELIGQGQDQEGLLSVKYVGLAPVLVRGMQEQQAAFEQERAARNAQLARKDAEIAALEAGATARQSEIAALAVFRVSAV
jgi:hypothetical protein